MPRQPPTFALRPATIALIEADLRAYGADRDQLPAGVVEGIENIYQRLQPRARLLVALRYWGGWKVSEIAPLVSLSAVAAGRWRRVIIEALAEELGRW